MESVENTEHSSVIYVVSMIRLFFFMKVLTVPFTELLTLSFIIEAILPMVNCGNVIRRVAILGWLFANK